MAPSGAAPALPRVLVMSPLPTCVGKRESGGQWLWAGCTSFWVVGSWLKEQECGAWKGRDSWWGAGDIVQECKQDGKVFSLTMI